MTTAFQRMEKHFDPAAARERWNREWDARGVFRADDASSNPNFVITLPPPNVTGVLHVGHVLGDTVQDHLIRWKHMRGYNTLWIPGTDHAGIATQLMVERELAEQGLTRQDLGRDRFLERAWAWKERYHGNIRR
ncbi:MAG: class I tRNA ligase family protein, partial [Candidatus Latescibacteria bacterium]|nr:class I tRNA ligase family protein [Candidatus Latescibacterota bacterium]